MKPRALRTPTCSPTRGAALKSWSATTRTTTPQNALGLTDDDENGSLPLPFSFNFFGTQHPANTTLFVSTNGLISIGTDPGVAWVNESLATQTSLPGPVIAPFWDDLHPRRGQDACNGDVFHDTISVGTTRVLVIEWRNMCDQDNNTTNDGYTFQVRLIEGENIIEFHYEDVNGGPFAPPGTDDATNLGGSATIGIAANADAWLQYSFHAPPDDDNGSQGTPFPPPNAPPAVNDFAIRFEPACRTLPSNGVAEVQVSTAAELDTAIRCYNGQSPAVDHRITFNNSIRYHGPNPPVGQPADTGGAVTIDSATDSGNLTVNGAGHALTGPLGSDGLGAPVTGFINLVTIDNANVETSIQNLIVNGADNTGIAVEDGSVTIDATTAHNNGGRTSEGLGSGIFVNGGTATIRNTATLNNDQGGIDLGTKSPVVTIVNTTSDGNTNGGVGALGGTAVIANSTLQSVNVFGGTTSVVSSIVTRGCFGITDLGNNFTSPNTTCTAFGNTFTELTAGSLAAAPGDNGGPTETITLQRGSNAIGGGDCTDLVDATGATFQVTTDQRGVTRPSGVACDAGAFEHPDNAPLGFVPVSPCAIFDTRDGAGLASGQETLTAQITGSVSQPGTDCADHGVVPANATAVMVNVVAVGPVASGNLRISAAGTTAEGGVVNFGPGNTGAGTNSNAVPVALSTNGALDVFVNSTAGAPATNVRLVVLGYYIDPTLNTNALGFVPVSPCAMFDTRAGDGLAAGQGTLVAQIIGSITQPGTECAASGRVPANAAAVMVNVVAVGPVASGNLRISASGTSAEGGVVNFGPGNTGAGTNSNAVPVALSAGGAVDVFVNASAGTAATHVRLVVLGYYIDPALGNPGRPPLGFVPVSPCAIYDTRDGAGIAAGQATLPAQITGSVSQPGTDCATAGVVPANAAAVMVNVVAVGPGASGNLRIAAAGTTAQGGVVNFGPGDTGAGTNSNAIPVALSPGGAVDVFVNASAGTPATNVRLVVLGYYT